MVIFHSFLYVYQRVPYVCPYFGGIYPPKFSPRTIGLKFRKVGTSNFYRFRNWLKKQTCLILVTLSIEWLKQCHKPAIWEWFIAPTKIVKLGMVYYCFTYMIWHYIMNHYWHADIGILIINNVLFVKIEGPGAGIPAIIIYLLLKGFLQTALL